MDVTLTLSGAAALLLVSALFSGSETAFFSLTRKDRQQVCAGRGLRPLALRRLLHRRQGLLMTLLLGNLLVNLLFFSLSYQVSRDLDGRGQTGAATGVAAGAVLLLVLLGEILPKTLARQHARAVSRFMGLPLYLLERLALPAVFLLSLVMRGAARLTGARREDAASREDLRRYADLLQSKGVLDAPQRRYLDEVLEFRELKVRDVMVPRVDVEAVDLEAPRDEIVARIRAVRVARVLAYDGDLDRVRGTLASHQLLLQPERPLEDLLQPLPAVPELGTAEGALHRMLERGESMLLVVDEYGGTAGLLTQHDLVEEILGELADEHRQTSVQVVDRGPGEYLVRGSTPLRDWREHTGQAEDAEGATTVAGLLLFHLDRFPRAGDEVRTEHFDYRILRVVGGRVLLVRARRREAAP